MKNIWIITALILLTTTASAAPVVEEVVVTPLYANVFSTLTCRYIVSNVSGSTTTQYEWYDGHDGVWYSEYDETYTDLENGYTYKCRVNITDNNGSSGWVESSNNVTINPSCLNPYPFFYVVENDTNMTAFFTAYNPLTFRFRTYGNGMRVKGGDFILLNSSFLFMGGDFYENTSTPPIYGWQAGNWLRGQQTSGSFTSDGKDTDENLTTYYAPPTISGGNIDQTDTGTYPTYSSITGSTEYPINNTLHIKTGVRVYSNGGTATAYIYIDVQKTDDSWENILTTSVSKSCSNGGGCYSSWEYTDDEYDISYQIKRVRIRTRLYSTSSYWHTGYYRIYELGFFDNFTGSTSSGPTSIEDFTQTEGSLYRFTYLDEETRNSFNFSTSSDLNNSELRIYCTSTITEISLNDSEVGKNYTVGIKELPRRLETLIEYDDGSDYYRRYTFCDRYADFNYYLVDATTTTPRLYTFTLDDDTGEYEEGHIKLKRYMDTVLEVASSDVWDAARQAMFYLVDNREYSITLVSEDCSSERNVGWVTTNPSSTTYELSLSGLDVNTTAYNTVFEYVKFNFELADDRINFTYIDPENETEWVWWGVYLQDNDSLVYEDNTTAVTSYAGSYLISNTSKYYYGKVIFSHPGGSVEEYVEGMLNRTREYFAPLNYEGEVLGLEYPTMYLLLSIAIIIGTGFLVLPTSVGTGAMIIWVETIGFSVVGWLPLFAHGNTAGWTVAILGLIITGAIAYTEKR